MPQEANRAYWPKAGAPAGNEETAADASATTRNPATSPPPRRSPLTTFALTVRRSSRPAYGLNGAVGVGSQRRRRRLCICGEDNTFSNFVHKEITTMSIGPGK